MPVGFWSENSPNKASAEHETTLQTQSLHKKERKPPVCLLPPPSLYLVSWAIKNQQSVAFRKDNIFRKEANEYKTDIWGRSCVTTCHMLPILYHSFSSMIKLHTAGVSNIEICFTGDYLTVFVRYQDHNLRFKDHIKF